MQIPGQFCVQINTASYASAGAGVTVSLALATAQNTGTASGTDTLTTIENLTGSALGDVLTGGTTANRIEGPYSYYNTVVYFYKHSGKKTGT